MNVLISKRKIKNAGHVDPGQLGSIDNPDCTIAIQNKTGQTLYWKVQR